MTASRTLLGIGVMSPSNVWMASERIYSRISAMAVEDLPRMRRMQKSARLWLRWQKF